MNERERPERGQPQGRQRQRSGQGNADVRSGRGAVTRRTRAGASSRQAGSRTRTAKKKDTANFRFLGVMLIVALLLCGGILAVKLLKDRADADGTRQTSAEPATVNVTFPEGRTVRQYGALLENNGVCAAEDFYNEMRVTDFTPDYSFLPSNDILQQREYPLEGYLYPDTYTFYVGENPRSVIKRFLKNFAVRVSDETVSYANANGEGFKRVEMSFDKAVILASIIERESPDNAERDKISAVFWNRMENPTVSGTGGKLQSDATHYYPYVASDERPEGFRSEYDTYDIVGLPKGPICNPSADSIRAAVYPDKDCKAYFFFNDKKGNHYYAETYAEHKKNIQYCKDNGLA
ncbi:MAG: endolytic transglycosylase MltG [Clostridia bacterium]|nr:endolytic transglycosylase MltG [Clostridia bacterium]